MSTFIKLEITPLKNDQYFFHFFLISRRECLLHIRLSVILFVLKKYHQSRLTSYWLILYRCISYKDNSKGVVACQMITVAHCLAIGVTVVGGQSTSLT